MGLKKIVKPPTKALIALICLSTLIVVMIFVSGHGDSKFWTPIYLLPFYTFVSVCVHIYDTFQSRIESIRDWFLSIPTVDWLCGLPIVERYRLDIIFKSQVRLYFSIAINIGYIVINVLAFFIYRTVWFLVIASYYTILLGMCITLHKFDKKVGFGKSKIDDLHTTRACAFVLLTLNLILLVAVGLIIHQDAGHHYNGIVIYFMVAYTFFTSALAAINLVRFSKYGNCVVTIIRMVVVAAALVSILTLVTALLFQFGADVPRGSKQILVIITGIGISTVIVGMAMRIIASTSDEIESLESSEKMIGTKKVNEGI